MIQIYNKNHTFDICPKQNRVKQNKKTLSWVVEGECDWCLSSAGLGINLKPWKAYSDYTVSHHGYAISLSLSLRGYAVYSLSLSVGMLSLSLILAMLSISLSLSLRGYAGLTHCPIIIGPKSCAGQTPVTLSSIQKRYEQPMLYILMPKLKCKERCRQVNFEIYYQ